MSATTALHAEAFEQNTVSLHELQRAQLPLWETTYLGLGGGIGTFVWVDHLRIYGAPAHSITALGVEPEPFARYRRLCENSQIGDHERLRSDAASTPDNIWGWPSYGLREAVRSLVQRQWGRAGRVAWQLFTEPMLAETYTPMAGDIYKALQHEARRIGWTDLWQYGRIRAIRKTDDERYAVLYTDRHNTPCVALAPYLHLAPGYPGIRMLPELRAYRARTKDTKRVVHAYEDHEHVYQHLATGGGTVILRGRGIVASRILQRIHEVRGAHPEAEIHVLHLMRTPHAGAVRYGGNQRPMAHHWQLQRFNFPKAMFTGDLRATFAQQDAETRLALLRTLGGVTTSPRRDWQRIVETGLREGWYQMLFGETHRLEPGPNHRPTLVADGATSMNLTADFVIDCTGLHGELERNPLLCDLVETYAPPRNGLGNLDVSQAFEVEALRNGRGRIFAAGVMTLGGPFAPVDSFLGLQIAARSAVEALVELDAPGLRALAPLRSLRQWSRWMRGVAP